MTSKMQLDCPLCSKKLRLESRLVGRTVRCPACGNSFDATQFRSDADQDSADLASARSVDGSNTSQESQHRTGGLTPVRSPSVDDASRDAKSGETFANEDDESTVPGGQSSARRLGRFELRRLLGQGAFGKVYLAYDPELEREVALKVLTFGPNQKIRVQRFLTEAKAAARLRHPNIVSTFLSGREESRYYIAAAFVDGELLSKVVKKQPLSVQRSVEIIRKLADALAYAHESDVVHRDVKPHNVMLDLQGEPHLMDFGLAKRVDDEAKVTSDGSVLGTPAYMSPEQARGEVTAVGQASDQYSLAVMLFQFLTGSTPFHGPPHLVIAEVAKGEVPPIRTVRKDIPADLAAVCDRALRKEPSQRYLSCREFAADLDNWANHRPVQARRQGGLRRAIRFASANKVMIGFGVVISLLLTSIAFAIGLTLFGSGMGEFASLPDQRIAMDLHEEANDVALSPAILESKDAGIPGLTSDLETATTERPSAIAESESDKLPELQIVELLREQDISLRTDIINGVQEALRIVSEAGYGHVVVGRIKMEGNASPSNVIAQMEILDDGYFVDAVATAGAPVYFWHPGYSRLDVVPHGKKGTIENLGEVKMTVSTKPGGVVKGVMVANGSEVPKELKATVTYSIPLINRCMAAEKSQSNRQLLSLRQDLLSRIAASGKESIEIVPETGEFKIASLNEVRFNATFGSADKDRWDRELEVSPGEEIDLSHCSMYRPDEARQAKPNAENTAWGPDGRPEYEKMLLTIKDDQNVLQYFARHFDEDLKSVEDVRAKGYDRDVVVIVGRIYVPAGEVDGSDVEAQMKIAKGGYFCAAVQANRPVGFRLHGYDALDYVPKGSQDGVEYCGVLRMTKTVANDTAAIQGSIILEGEQPSSDLRVHCSEKIVNINWWNNSAGTFGGRGNPKQSPNTNINGNEFQLSNLSPIDYTISVSSSGFVNQSRTVRFQPGENRTMPPFYLFQTRSVSLTHLASKTGHFVDESSRTSLVDTGNGRWRSFEDAGQYGAYGGQDLILEQYGNAVFARASYAPCYIADLGARDLEECRSINVDGALTQNDGGFNTYLLREGHVYLLKQWYWKHWVLFKVDGITLAPLTEK